MRLGGMCINWKVVAGLAVVGVGIWVVKPTLIGAALPLLILAACPLSMLLMMRGMGGQCATEPQGAGEQAAARTLPPGLTRDEQLAELWARATSLQSRHEAITRELALLEAEQSPAVREAEAVALAAERRVRG